MDDLTTLRRLAANGRHDPRLDNELFQRVYRELRKIAGRRAEVRV